MLQIQQNKETEEGDGHEVPEENSGNGASGTL